MRYCHTSCGSGALCEICVIQVPSSPWCPRQEKLTQRPPSASARARWSLCALLLGASDSLSSEWELRSSATGSQCTAAHRQQACTYGNTGTTPSTPAGDLYPRS